MTYEIWLIITAIIFTGVGFMFGFNMRTKLVVEGTINALIDQGYLRHRKKPDGTTEVLKLDGTK